MGLEEGLLCQSERAGRIALYQNLLTQAPADASSIAFARALLDEPLTQERGHPLPWLNRLQGHIERAMHLSIHRLFLCNESMRDLGLPTAVLPWYPALRLPVHLVRHHLLRLVPGGRQSLITQGRAEQQAYLAQLFAQHTTQGQAMHAHG